MVEFSIFRFYDKMGLDDLVRVRFRDNEEAHFPLSMLSNMTGEKERIMILMPDDETRDVMDVSPATINVPLLEDHGFKPMVGAKGVEYNLALNGNTHLKIRPILATEETRYQATLSQFINKDKEVQIQLGQWKYFFFITKAYELFTNKKLKWHRKLTA